MYISKYLINIFQIERWWKELHERLEKFFKQPLNRLKDDGNYDPHNEFIGKTHKNNGDSIMADGLLFTHFI